MEDAPEEVHTRHGGWAEDAPEEVLTRHGGWAEDAPEEVHAEDDLERGAPDHVDEEDQVHELLGVHRHQVSRLAN